MSSNVTRITLARDPDLDAGYTFGSPSWPAWWIGPEDWDGVSPVVAAFRRCFSLSATKTVRVHVTADQRYDLYLDGVRVAWGPERGDHENWYYQTYDLALDAGEHTLVTRVWWGGTGELAPCAQVTARPGLMVYAEGEANDLLTTGVAAWDALILPGYELVRPQVTDTYCVPGGRTVLHGEAHPWGYETGVVEGGDEGWRAAERVAPVALRAQGGEKAVQWWLRPSLLPQMLERTLRVGMVRAVSDMPLDTHNDAPVRKADDLVDELAAWQRVVSGEAGITIPPETSRRVLIDLDDYYCAWPQLTTSGGAGAEIRVAWAESLFVGTGGFDKGDRNAVEGKYYRGLWDTYLPDGGVRRALEPLWWEAGRYVMVSVRTAGEPLTVDSFAIREAHYPYEFESTLAFDDSRWDAVGRLARRVLEMCSHETYMDCPYYEQLMYAGDTRLEILTTYALTRDERLPRKAIVTFDGSRSSSGLTRSRHPARVTQVIPPFSLWWVMMVRDYALWRDDPAFVAARMQGVRAVLEAFRRWIGDDGLLHAPRGWNFVDWVPEWPKGMPPGAESDVNATLNLQTSMVFRAAAELEEWANEPSLASRNRATADTIASACVPAFWDDARALFAEDREHTTWSEHAQCMAQLGGALSGEARERNAAALLDAPDLARTTVYFSYYLLDTLRVLGRIDRLYERLDLWFGLEAQGLRTVVEMPEPTRSDCHAWGSHPLFHAYATLCGIRPAAPGFARVSIAPQPGPLTKLTASLVHPRGTVEMDLALRDGRWRGTLSTPDGVPARATLPDGTNREWTGGAIAIE